MPCPLGATPCRYSPTRWPVGNLLRPNRSWLDPSEHRGLQRGGGNKLFRRPGEAANREMRIIICYYYQWFDGQVGGTKG